MAGGVTGKPDLGNDSGKIPPFRIPRQVLKVAGKPELYAALGLLGMCFEGIIAVLVRLRSSCLLPW